MSITTVIDATTCLPRATPLPYLIYALTERATGRIYVGLTTRTLAQRISAHLSQARRPRTVRPDGLMNALRRMLDAGGRFGDMWEARIVGRAATTDQARVLETHWITTLSAARPTGYNIMPGGRSVGGPDNAVPVTVVLPDGSSRNYACIQHAIVDSNDGEPCSRTACPSPGHRLRSPRNGLVARAGPGLRTPCRRPWCPAPDPGRGTDFRQPTLDRGHDGTADRCAPLTPAPPHAVRL